MHVGRVREAKGRTRRAPTWRGKAEDGGRGTKELWGDPGKSDILEPMGEKANFKKGTVITVICCSDPGGPVNRHDNEKRRYREVAGTGA